MANDDQTKRGGGLGGRDLQDSQAGGEAGEFGSRPQAQPAGGGVTASDISSAGGSSGTGGYGKSEDLLEQRDAQPDQGAQPGPVGKAPSVAVEPAQSRGERYDEAQGGGRGALFDGTGGVSESAEEEDGDRPRSEAEDFEREAD